ncbi:outer membrane beta-barrel protein, partial [Pedobacter sp. ASV12]|uniref:outer membrane beta-barrel protein n=1 Tax=Pedobacter sp. ASV12 TaxID=2795120 RepID=UPI0018ED7501
TYINVGTSESYGFNVFASYNPLPKWTLMSNLGINTYQVNNIDANTGSFGNVSGTKTFVNYNIFLRSATTFKKGWSFEAFGAVNSPRYTFQGKTGTFFINYFAVKKEILNKKGSIAINALNPFQRDLKINSVTESSFT